MRMKLLQVLGVSGLILGLLLFSGPLMGPRTVDRSPEWREVGQWSGSDDPLPERMEFEIDGAPWRVAWSTMPRDPDQEPSFALTIYPADEPLEGSTEAAVTHQEGPHGGVELTSVPGWYRVEIFAAGVDWWVSVREAVPGN
jgi:hypothetical protein